MPPPFNWFFISCNISLARSFSLALGRANSPSLKRLNSSPFKTPPQLFSRPLYKGLDNISITRGKFNEFNLSRVSAFASRAAAAIALFFGRWVAPCLAERPGLGSSCPGPSVGGAEASLPLAACEHRSGKADDSEAICCRSAARGAPAPGSWESRERRFCLLPSTGRGEGKLPAPPRLRPRLLRCFPGRRNRTPKEEAEQHQIYAFKSLQKKSPSNGAYCSAVSPVRFFLFFESAYSRGKNGNGQSLFR